MYSGLVGCGEGVMYLTSPGRPTDILAYSWARPADLVAGKGRGGRFFISSVSFVNFPLYSMSLSFISFAISFLWETTK